MQTVDVGGRHILWLCHVSKPLMVLRRYLTVLHRQHQVTRQHLVQRLHNITNRRKTTMTTLSLSSWCLVLSGQHLFHNSFLLQSIPSTPLNGSLRNVNTWRVLVGNRTLRRDFLGTTPTPKIWGPKNYLILTTSQLNGNFDWIYLWPATWYTQSGKQPRKLWRVSYIVPRLHVLWSTNS